MIEIFQHNQYYGITVLRLTVSWGGGGRGGVHETGKGIIHCTVHYTYTVNVADTAQREGEFMQPKMLHSGT